jgi:sugar lactone lactonase YvrE
MGFGRYSTYSIALLICVSGCSEDSSSDPGSSGATGGSAGSSTGGKGGSGGGSGGTGGSGNAGSGGTAGAAGGTAGTGGAAGAGTDAAGGTGGSSGSAGFLDCATPEVVTVAGADDYEDVDGPGGPTGIARLRNPRGMAALGATGLLVADMRNGKIKEIEVTLPALTVDVTTLAVTFAGTPNSFSDPIGIAIAANDDVYVADTYNQVIRKVVAGSVSTLAGDGEENMTDGQGTAAQFHYPMGIAFGTDGALYIADNGSHAVRRMDSSANVTTVAGTNSPGAGNGAAASAQFNFPTDVSVGADGAIYVADSLNHMIRKIASGTVSTLAGTGSSGFMDGAGASAQFATPEGVVAHPDGRLFVADSGNQRIRVISATGEVSTLAGAATADGGTPTSVDGPVTSARFANPMRLAITAAGLTVADQHRIRLVFCR